MTLGGVSRYGEQMIPPSHVRAMRYEIEKRAVNLAGVGRMIAANPKKMMGAIGAGGGALVGAGREAMRKTQPGEKKHYLGAAARGAALGGVAGVGAGALGRGMADTRLLQQAAGKNVTAGSVIGGTAKRIGTGIKDFAGRQAHGFTGKFEGSMVNPLKRKAQVMDLRAAADIGKKGKGLNVFAGKSMKGNMARGELAHRQNAMKSGVTSLTGIAKGMKDPKRLAKAMWSEGTGGGGALGATLGVGVPAAMAIPDLAKGDESDKGGRTVKQKLVRHGVGLGAGIATAGLPIIPQMMAGSVAEGVGSRISGEKGIKENLARAQAQGGRQ